MCAPCCAVPSSSRGSRLSGTVPRTVPVVPRTVPVVPRTVPVVPRTVPVVPRTVPVVPQHCPSGTPALSQWCPSTVPVVPRTVPVVPAPRCPPPATTAGHRAGPCLDAPGSDDLFAERERHRDTERGKCPGDETRRDETRRAKPGQGAVRAVKRRPASSPFGRSEWCRLQQSTANIQPQSPHLGSPSNVSVECICSNRGNITQTHQ